MNGMLEVEVTVLHNGKVVSTVIEQRPGQLSQAQIEATRARLAPLKIRLRDQLPHRARLERANRLYGELKGQERDTLTLLLDHFESALESQVSHDAEQAAGPLDDFLGLYFRAEVESQNHPEN